MTTENPEPTTASARIAEAEQRVREVNLLARQAALDLADARIGASERLARAQQALEDPTLPPNDRDAAERVVADLTSLHPQRLDDNGDEPDLPTTLGYDAARVAVMNAGNLLADALKVLDAERAVIIGQDEHDEAIYGGESDGPLEPIGTIKSGLIGATVTYENLDAARETALGSALKFAAASTAHYDAAELVGIAEKFHAFLTGDEPKA